MARIRVEVTQEMIDGGTPEKYSCTLCIGARVLRSLFPTEQVCWGTVGGRLITHTKFGRTTKRFFLAKDSRGYAVDLMELTQPKVIYLHECTRAHYAKWNSFTNYQYLV